MDELVDILDENGKGTGNTCLKSKAHQEGLLHPTVHIWFYTNNGKVLLQQRGKEKDTFPLRWDVSVAGHVGAGEDITLAAEREILEEIGLAIKKTDLEKIGVFKSVQHHHERLIDREFHHTFLCELKVPFNSLRKQENEVADLKLIPLTRFSEETWGMANPSKYVPHDISYYATIVKEIRKRL